jgi:hypothetical protein
MTSTAMITDTDCQGSTWAAAASRGSGARPTDGLDGWLEHPPFALQRSPPGRPSGEQE